MANNRDNNSKPFHSPRPAIPPVLDKAYDALSTYFKEHLKTHTITSIETDFTLLRTYVLLDNRLQLQLNGLSYARNVIGALLFQTQDLKPDCGLARHYQNPRLHLWCHRVSLHEGWPNDVITVLADQYLKDRQNTLSQSQSISLGTLDFRPGHSSLSEEGCGLTRETIDATIRHFTDNRYGVPLVTDCEPHGDQDSITVGPVNALLQKSDKSLSTHVSHDVVAQIDAMTAEEINKAQESIRLTLDIIALKKGLYDYDLATNGGAVKAIKRIQLSSVLTHKGVTLSELIAKELKNRDGVIDKAPNSQKGDHEAQNSLESNYSQKGDAPFLFSPNKNCTKPFKSNDQLNISQEVLTDGGPYKAGQEIGSIGRVVPLPLEDDIDDEHPITHFSKAPFQIVRDYLACCAFLADCGPRQRDAVNALMVYRLGYAMAQEKADPLSGPYFLVKEINSFAQSHQDQAYDLVATVRKNILAGYDEPAIIVKSDFGTLLIPYEPDVTAVEWEKRYTDLRRVHG